ncbi:MAG: helix-hairpin-helix domain-containing protein [Candidatus Dadabacteria bacterium]
MIDNYFIANQLSLLSKLMEIHGENSFKAKSYSVAAFTLEKLQEEVAEMPVNQLFKVKGIGESVGKKILEIIESGELTQLQELLTKTPQGVLEMLNIKGIGPKKIHVLWKELHIDTIEELRKACEENRLSSTKGFGEKTEQKILSAIQFKEGNTGRYKYRQVESFAESFQQKLQHKFPKYKIQITGEYRRQLEVISKLEWVTTIPSEPLKKFILNEETELISESADLLIVNIGHTLEVLFHLTGEKDFFTVLFTTTGSEDFINEWSKLENVANIKSEESVFTTNHLNYIPPFLREKTDIIEIARKRDFTDIVEVSDIKGLIHSHSNWSDGGHTIEQMAKALIDLGFEYLVISDHSKAAYYAGGLSEERIIEQHTYIDELNRKLKPFKIFKSIECDILSDGSLDYDDKVLSSFDLVITSIHSNLQMNEEKAMKRLLGAISNPYTTILGHMTGRLLLKRNGYPVDHKRIIEACAKNNVVIEINANPNRLDMDWRWIDYALENEVMLSIDPDAHTIEEFELVKYGVLVAQKGALPSSKNLSSKSLKEFESFLVSNRQSKRIS